jgi:hypothetical protein
MSAIAGPGPALIAPIAAAWANTSAGGLTPGTAGKPHSSGVWLDAPETPLVDWTLPHSISTVILVMAATFTQELRI